MKIFPSKQKFCTLETDGKGNDLGHPVVDLGYFYVYRDDASFTVVKERMWLKAFYVRWFR